MMYKTVYKTMYINMVYLLQKQDELTKYADNVQLNRNNNNNLTVRASLPGACHVQHAPGAVLPPSDNTPVQRMQ